MPANKCTTKLWPWPLVSPRPKAFAYWRASRRLSLSPLFFRPRRVKACHCHILVRSSTLDLRTIAASTASSHTAQTGNRPKGWGLFSYLRHYIADGVGVLGYDPILGALSPPLRVRIHIAAAVACWAALLSIWPTRYIPDACFWANMSLAFWESGFVAIMTYLYVFYAINQLPGVSDPGGPRAHKIQRKPQWEDKELPLPKAADKWRFAVGAAGHEITEQRQAGTSAALTGEPAGRDIWTTVDGGKKPRVDERLVAELASGGRSGFNPALNPNAADLPFRAQMIRQYLANGGKPPSKAKVTSVKDALHKAVHFYSMLQTDDGHWSGDYGGPHFLMPGLIVAWYVMGRPSRMLDKDEIEMMKHYIIVHQQSDGGWGTHSKCSSVGSLAVSPRQNSCLCSPVESPSTMFGTTMNYVALRLMGMDAEDPVCQKGRDFIKEQGGAIMTSSWAKFYLCMLGCMHWDGHNSVPPEMWLLPNWFPFHPGRMWCHARMVYLPMGYIYGARFVYDKAESDPVVLALRKELYCQPYDSIPWMRTRHMVADMDNYSPLHWVMATAQNALARYETWPIFQPFKNFVRKRGLAFCLDYMAAEDLQTNFIDIGPVNKVLNMVSAFHAVGGDLNHTTVANHLARVPDYLWFAEDGLKMKGYNGSQCWDTSFAIQAVYEAGLLDEFPDVSRKVWRFLERCQILSTEVSQATPAYKYESAAFRKTYYRHISEGGWPFSTSAHGWPISDCTSEGLKGALCLLKTKTVAHGLKDGTLKAIGEKRLQNAVNVLLTYQNEDGGWATYENNRGYGWYECLNPSEVFGDIMIDYSYVECSVATLTALVEFHEEFPMHRSDEIKHAISKGRDFVKSIQRTDGSWYGSWACCFCYGCWFGIEGLVKCGEPMSSDSITRACDFLLKHQRPNGGWGEDFTSCYDKDYAKGGMEDYGDEGSGVVNTAWALLALSAAQCEDGEAIRRGVAYLIQRQLPCGDWPQEGIAGVFNRACGITYTAYRNVFPIWALGRCRATYGATIEG